MAPNTRVFNGSSAMGGQKCQWRSTGNGPWVPGGEAQGHTLGGDHPRWETEWVGGVGVMAQGQEMGEVYANQLWGVMAAPGGWW